MWRYSLAWAEMYIALAALAPRFDFQFYDANAADFLASFDQFAIGTRSGGHLKATVSSHVP